MHIFTDILFKLKRFPTKPRRIRVTNLIFCLCLLTGLWLCWVAEDPCYVPRHLRRYLQFPEDYEIAEKKLSEDNLKNLILQVERLNAQADVVNWNARAPTDAVVVVLAHRDVERLQHLIISLGQVRFIDRVLLIFSHRYFDEEINTLVRSIHFCRVLQYFYPYSLQLYPNTFPGVDPDDCNASLTASPATREPCFVRDARRIQPKLHWWWTANYVFESEWRSDKCLTIFLEEDSYVLPDLLHMLKLSHRVLPYFPSVQVLAFGGPYTQAPEYDLLTIDAWSPPYDNGLALSLNTWRKISAKSSFFCFFEDCRWSHSLASVFGNFSGGFVDMVASSAPRVLRTRAFPSAGRAAHEAWREARRARLFPRHVRAALTVRAQPRGREGRGEGGCSDLRDQVLCLDPLMTTTTDVTTDTTLYPIYEIKNISRSR
ncbi:alpha-1,6-mannosyl-glycoprotein 2-beta-N-acetylglucosaminyltransferase-like [Ostrinia furnacalis]|uniref:alpha-1,6-mannosyl-glycoprotein 2-beta-N-acetylglucosaminyltransferase-like n=1 Tax=Ostrinia furnacalis TaxID=93504 RepID=UPI0010388BCE|nr:alpha-1,6-mannosyl-glycoprotein 2-beta-N-acetylglucosaminyltransferase-like [Ostrinia furnacalis]